MLRCIIHPAYKDPQNKIPVRIGVIVILIGMIFGGLSIFQIFSQLDLQANSVSATGKVVDMEFGSTYSGNYRTTYQPTFLFVDENGEEQTGRSVFLSSSYDFAEGEMVPIRYDRRDPAKVYLGGWMDVWGFALIFGGVAALFLITGLKYLDNIRKYWKKSRQRRKKRS